MRMLSKVPPATLLDWKIAQMGSLAEQQLAWAINALARRDPDLANIATANATAIKILSLELQEELTLIIANRRPNAGDLRQIMSSTQAILSASAISEKTSCDAHWRRSAKIN